MKRLLILLLGVILCNVFAYAQIYQTDLKATMLKDFKHLKKGSEIKISKVRHNIIVNQYGVLEDEYSIIVGSDTLPVNSKIGDRFDFKYEYIQDLWNAQIISNVLVELQKKGVQEGLRQEMEEEALNYINKQQEYGLVFNDPYLENYIYGLVSKIAPVTLIDSRPGNVNLLLVDSPDLNACMFPNGTMVINTGLLAALHTEDELVAILSHEIAHFVLDHSVQNVNKATERKKRAEFWAALATGLTAIAEGVAASQNRYYIPGAATLGMAALSSSIARQVVDRLGMRYNAEQEKEADQIAVKALELLGYDRNALATALNRMKDNMVLERSHAMYFQTYSHPALINRIYYAGKPQSVVDLKFEQEISFAVTGTARMKFEDRRFRQVLPLVNQNIYNGTATSEDYILKANCLLALYNDTQTNLEILELISYAKELDNTNINIYKAEILANLRMKKYETAYELLVQYVQSLEQLKVSLKEIESDITWDANNRFIMSKSNWAKRMIIKTKAMQELV